MGFASSSHSYMGWAVDINIWIWACGYQHMGYGIGDINMWRKGHIWSSAVLALPVDTETYNTGQLHS